MNDEAYLYKKGWTDSSHQCNICGRPIGYGQEVCWKCTDMKDQIDALDIVIEELNEEIEKKVKEKEE